LNKPLKLVLNSRKKTKKQILISSPACRSIPLLRMVLTMDHVQTRRISIFQPGYRHDAMVAFPSTNRYCIFDTNLNIDDEINAIPTSGQITPQLAPGNTLNAQLL